MASPSDATPQPQPTTLEKLITRQQEDHDGVVAALQGQHVFVVALHSALSLCNALFYLTRCNPIPPPMIYPSSREVIDFVNEKGCDENTSLLLHCIAHCASVTHFFFVSPVATYGYVS